MLARLSSVLTCKRTYLNLIFSHAVGVTRLHPLAIYQPDIARSFAAQALLVVHPRHQPAAQVQVHSVHSNVCQCLSSPLSHLTPAASDRRRYAWQRPMRAADAGASQSGQCRASHPRQAPTSGRELSPSSKADSRQTLRRCACSICRMPVCAGGMLG